MHILRAFFVDAASGEDASRERRSAPRARFGAGDRWPEPGADVTGVEVRLPGAVRPAGVGAQFRGGAADGNEGSSGRGRAES